MKGEEEPDPITESDIPSGSPNSITDFSAAEPDDMVYVEYRAKHEDGVPAIDGRVMHTFENDHVPEHVNTVSMADAEKGVFDFIFVEDDTHGVVLESVVEANPHGDPHHSIEVEGIDTIEIDKEGTDPDESDGDQLYDPGVVCAGCGKHVTGMNTPERCADCGGMFVPATGERLACDRCGYADAGRVFGNENYNRLCDHCIREVNDPAPLVYDRDGNPLRVRMVGASCEGDVSGEGHYGYRKESEEADQPTIYFEPVKRE